MRQILYVSTSTDPGNEADLDSILYQSRHNCALDGVAGVLLAHNESYLQVLEGEENAIADTMSRIRADARHVDMRIIIDREVDRRDFQGWSMAYRHKGEPCEKFEARAQQLFTRASEPVRAHVNAIFEQQLVAVQTFRC